MKLRFIALGLLLVMLGGCGVKNPVPEPVVTTQEETTQAMTEATTEPTTAPTTEATTVPTTAPPEPGWHTQDDGRTYYILPDGTRQIGWMELDGELRYFDEAGYMARGEYIIDGQTYHFDGWGRQLILVNPWHSLPEDHNPELVDLPWTHAAGSIQVDAQMYDALMQMMNDCNSVCPSVCVVSGYRTWEDQTRRFENRVLDFMAMGHSEAEAREIVATRIAVPGTSEHQLGLAVDIVDTRNWSLVREQEELPAQQWLMEHCWEYGFILRYPDNMIPVTGIMYEPWHYRYVGTDLSLELQDLGLTLEEYIASFTEDQNHAEGN